MSSKSTGSSPPSAAAGLPRVADLIAASLGLLVLSPLLLMIGVAVKVGSSGPVIFRQKRVGQGGQMFSLLKFRSMEQRAGGIEITAAGDPRVTGVGRFLRRLKLDELPSLWNVATGDMALVGPRPEVPRYMDLSKPAAALVLSARPGLTDPVTIRLRNEEDLLATVEDPESFYRETLQPYKLIAYGEYLLARSAGSDARVLMTTLLAIVRPHRTPPPTIEEMRAKVSADRDRNPLQSATD